MALKQLMLNKKIEQRKCELVTLQTRSQEFATREAELVTSIDEAKTDEEVAVVESEIEKLDSDKAENEAAKSALETEIIGLEAELEELRSKMKNVPTPVKQKNVETEGVVRMRNNGFFNGMSSDQRSAFIKNEEVSGFLERARTLKGQTRAVTGAELAIPDVMLEMLRDNLHRYSKLIMKVRLKPVAGKARQTIAGAIPEGIWTEAVASLNELALSFKQIEVDGYKVGGFIPVPNSTLEDSDINLANEIMDSLGQAIGFAVDKAILFGTGTKMPSGIATRLAQSTEPSNWGANSPKWVDLHLSNVLKLDPASMTSEEFFAALILKLGVARANYSTGDKIWCMNSRTKSALQAKAIAFNAAGAIVSAQNNTMPVIGGEIIELDFIADNDIIGGYSSLYLLAERAGANLAVSDQVRFIEDQTVFKGTARYDGKPILGEGFVIVNIANANPTTTVPFASDAVNFNDASLSMLEIGSLTLSPAFNKDVINYAATTTTATNTIKATPVHSDARLTIKNGAANVNNNAATTWAVGANELKVIVEYGTTKRVYQVTVTK